MGPRSVTATSAGSTPTTVQSGLVVRTRTGTEKVSVRLTVGRMA